MRYYEITNMDDMKISNVGQTRVIDENELDRRLLEMVHYDLEKSKQILLHGKVKEAPDPWEEWAKEVAYTWFRGDEMTHMEAALLKLKALVEKKD